MKKIILFFLVLMLVFCGRQEKELPAGTAGQQGNHERLDSEAPEGAQEAEHLKSEEHEHAELRVSPDKQKEWGIIIASASSQNISSAFELPGVLTVNQNKTAQISSFVRGKIVSYAVDLGDRVKEGDPLVIINSPEFAQAQANFLQARAKYLLSQKEYERAEMLRAEKAIEEKEYLRRQAEYERLATEYGALGSALHSYGITHKQIDELIKKCKAIEEKEYKCDIADPNLPILSPISGTVIFRDVVKGEHVDPQKILFTVSDLNTLWAVLDAYEKDIPFIRKDSQVKITSPLYTGRDFEGKIEYISDLIDEKLRTIKIRIEVDNSERLLKPNMYILGIVENRLEQKDAIVVPEEAIQSLNGEKIVFLPEEGDIFALRHVELGNRIGDKRVIVTGLKRGEKIVVKGAFYLKAELSKSTFGHTHVH
jgi:cobalt-zinc-cadmium efflux system membrane fusion protein